jgi:1-deoxyxylulose-5-phosphate synthase
VAASDRRNTLLGSYENAAVIVSGIDAAQLGHPTPCPQYDVAALIDHLVEASRRAAALGRGQAPPPGDRSPHVELSDAPGQLRAAAGEAARAWGDDASLSLRHTMPWGEEHTGAELLDMYVAELAAHAWDLATATGQLGRLDPSLAWPALEGARAMIKPQYRDLLGPGVPFGAEVSPAHDADDWECLAAFTGRDPRRGGWRSDAGSVLGDCRLVLGGQFGVEPFERSERRLNAFAAAGGVALETAYSYAGGAGIAAVGRLMRERPGRLEVVVKVGHDRQGREMPLSLANVTHDVTDGLTVLGVEAAGVVMLHCDDVARDVEELAGTLTSLVEAGYARSVGVSNWRRERLAQLAVALGRRGHRPLASYHYSLAVPDPRGMRGSDLAADDALIKAVDQARLPLLSWSANAGGYFSRDDGRGDRGEPFDTAASRGRRTRCAELARRLGLAPATVALAWVLARAGTFASVGAGTAAHLDEAFQAAGLRLSADDVAWLAGS